jgi:hypothetical protein
MHNDATITKTQRNDVLQLLQRYAGFDGSEFTLDDSVQEEQGVFGYESYRSTQLLHKQTGYYFRFGCFLCMYSPGSRSKVEAMRHDSNWEAIRELFLKWASRVKKESEAPDLWAMIGSEQALGLQASATTDNRLFSPQEQATIAANLEEVRTSIVTLHNLREEDRQFMDENFNYLKEASRRVGRKDWLLLTYGTLVNTAVTLAMTPPVAQGFLQLAASLFQWVLNTGQHLLTPAPI